MCKGLRGQSVVESATKRMILKVQLELEEEGYSRLDGDDYKVGEAN